MRAVPPAPKASILVTNPALKQACGLSPYKPKLFVASSDLIPLRHRRKFCVDHAAAPLPVHASTFPGRRALTTGGFILLPFGQQLRSHILLGQRETTLTIHSKPPANETAAPSQEEVEAAFRTIIRWAGDDPCRPGLVETPSRAARAFREYFVGYDQDPIQILNKTFDETGGYEEMVVLQGISFESHCEHHLAPIVGQRRLQHPFSADEIAAGSVTEASSGI